VVQRLGDSENLIGDLIRVIMNLEKAKQTAETRLHNRLKRPGDENVKDNAQLRYFASPRRSTTKPTIIKIFLIFPRVIPIVYI